MTDYDARVIEAIGSLPRLLYSRMFLLPAVAALLPAAVVYSLNVWPLFAAFLIVLGLYGRSLRLSGLLCWVAVSTTVFLYYLYYLYPDPGHFRARCRRKQQLGGICWGFIDSGAVCWRSKRPTSRPEALLIPLFFNQLSLGRFLVVRQFFKLTQSDSPGHDLPIDTTAAPDQAFFVHQPAPPWRL